MNRLMTPALLAVALSLGGCATVLDASGKATTATGNIMTDTGKKLDGNKAPEEKQGLTMGGLLQKAGSFQAGLGDLVRGLTGKKADNTPASDGKSSGK